MKKNPVPLPARIVRTNIILTLATLAVFPWLAIFVQSWIPQPLYGILLFLQGWLAWTLIEYCLHRWAFRKKRQRNPEPYLQYSNPRPFRRFGSGHRILATLLLILSCGTPFTGQMLFSYAGGILFGASCYVIIHWFFQRIKSALLFPILMKQQIWHLSKDSNKCFGVTSTFWDRMLNTHAGQITLKPKQIIDFYLKHEEIDKEEIEKIYNTINGENSYQ
jgi:4-hydroxysphinganine ceramide fatty acyl 2-hydroxylase